YFDDVSGVSMMTVVAPFYTADKKLLGVATDDITLTDIQKTVSGTKVGETGWAFLLDKSGQYLSHPESEKLMHKTIQTEENTSFAEAGA
ncbi:cache domain-containing protein, partial [Bacillus sp. SIMBA_074]